MVDSVSGPLVHELHGTGGYFHQRLTRFLQITSTGSQARLERDRGDLQDEEEPHWLGGEFLDITMKRDRN